jgi:uroporphyrinogen-III decarboxylase
MAWVYHDPLGGFIMAMGCAIPPNAKFENVQAMVDSVR